MKAIHEIETKTELSESNKAKRIYWCAWACSLLLLALMIPLLKHTSYHARFFEKYSASYVFIIILNISALALCLHGLRKNKLNPHRCFALLSAPGLIFFTIGWAILTTLCCVIYLKTLDVDFKNFTHALVAVGILCGWIFVLSERLVFRNVINKAALAVGAFCFALVVLEIILRVLPMAGVQNFRQERIGFLARNDSTRSFLQDYNTGFSTDPILGYRHRPLGSIPDTSEFATPNSRIQLDAWGFRNKNFEPSKPYDVVFIGDSFVASSWSQNVTRATNLRIANFGVIGYSPVQYNEILKRYALQVSPKTIFYCLYLNDASDCAIYQEWRNSGQDWFQFRGGLWFGALDPHVGRRFLEMWSLKSSYIYSLIEFIRFTRKDHQVPLSTNRISYQNDNFHIDFNQDAFQRYAAMDRPEIQRGFKLLEDSLSEAARICQQNKIKMIVLLIPPKELVHYELLQTVVEPNEPIQNLPDFYQTLALACQKRNIEYFDLTERFRTESVASGKAYYRRSDIHWNADGDQLFAKITSEILNSTYSATDP